MNKIIFFLVLFIVCISCENNGTERKEIDTKIVGTETADTISVSKTVFISDQNDFLSDTVRMDRIKFNGLGFLTEKQMILKFFGPPDSIIEPKYDCGPFSEDWQDLKFYQYFYSKMNYIVYGDTAEIQNIEFDKNDLFEIGSAKLNTNLSFKEVAVLLGLEYSDKADTTKILLYPIQKLDEHFILIFKNGHLYQFDRLEPC